MPLMSITLMYVGLKWFFCDKGFEKCGMYDY